MRQRREMEKDRESNQALCCNCEFLSNTFTKLILKNKKIYSKTTELDVGCIEESV